MSPDTEPEFTTTTRDMHEDGMKDASMMRPMPVDRLAWELLDAWVGVAEPLLQMVWLARQGSGERGSCDVHRLG